jgi:hypothetical protein
MFHSCVMTSLKMKVILISLLTTVGIVLSLIYYTVKNDN